VSRGGQAVEYGRSYPLPAGIAFHFGGLMFYNYQKQNTIIHQKKKNLMTAILYGNRTP